ncbi:MAG: peptidase S41 [Alphaproteobacteria bacterium CG11_big_fil_rev_8_21_14_0_20_39_49]|nr:MAG: peptidase S41 [Alphaproteobacteria bacterium CG11_big_fil_rev_8_21_14_0_20_39_49]
MNKQFYRIFLILVVSFFTTSAQASSKDTIKLLDLFGDVFDKVKRDYVEEVDDKELVESAINGMLSSLDPHSSYLNENDFDEMRIQTRGEFGGLGIEVTMENGLVKVVSPIDDTPAYRAGLEAGDYISQIDGEAVMGTTLSEAVDKMRGKPGTEIELTVLREGENEPLTFNIKRDIIKIKSVRARKEGDDIVYARITSFSETTADSLKREVKKLKSEIGDEKFKGVVLDLRNNPGGLLDQAIEVSDAFLDKGEIVSTGGRVPDSNKRFNASRGDIIDGKPIVVMINGGSASASEIVSGALQDHKRGIVIGTKSFGKGSVQTVIPLSASKGAMRLTTSRYYTPAGRSIQAEGIEPDIIVEQAKLEEIKARKMSSEANLRKHLKNNNGGSGGSENSDASKTAEGEKEDTESVYEKDYQLGRALDLLRGIHIYNESKM